MLLLFLLSLIPFSTAYLGEQHFSRAATLLYLVSLLLPALAYTWLQGTIRVAGEDDAGAAAYHRSSRRKGRLAVGLYVMGIALSFVAPALGIACAALVAGFWMLPASPLDDWFAR